MTVTLSQPLTSDAKANGRFGKQIAYFKRSSAKGPNNQWQPQPANPGFRQRPFQPPNPPGATNMQKWPNGTKATRCEFAPQIENPGVAAGVFAFRGLA
ncbi:hypothetical protein [Bradyrhizobium macuxiense]|nr:hypothetical protein [Bradyrhizobium macuxiense]